MEVGISQYEEFPFSMITEAPELMNQTARDVSITEVNIAAAGDMDAPLMEYIPVESILGVLGGAEVYLDGERLLLYQEDAFVIRMYVEQDDRGAAYLVCTFVEINSPMYENVESLAILEALSDLNVDTENQPFEACVFLRESGDETLFNCFKSYGLENADYDEMIALYKDYFERMGVDYAIGGTGDGNDIISYAEESGLYPGIIYETRAEFGREDGMVCISVGVAEYLEEEY